MVYVEDMSLKKVIPLAFSHLSWFEASLVELLQQPSHSPFFKHTRDDYSATCLVKSKLRSGWFIQCIVWPSTGGRKSIQVRMDLRKRGGSIFWKLLQDCLKNCGCLPLRPKHQ